jgi:sulfur relay (sulfurtransferase) DsrC/TusE family protein
MWINKTWTLQRVHLEVFKFFRHYFSRFYIHDTLTPPF